MENTERAQQEQVNQIYSFARNLLINEKKNVEEVKDILMEQGVDQEDASIVVENLMQEQSQKRKNANNNMLYGSLWCTGGIIATVADIGAVFWGAIVFGGIQFMKGASEIEIFKNK